MPTFSLRHPYLIIVGCLLIMVLGLTSIVQIEISAIESASPTRNFRLPISRSR